MRGDWGCRRRHGGSDRRRASQFVRERDDAFFGPENVAAQNQANLDQINVSCYDDFEWSFTHVWHNAALYDPLDQGQNRSCQNVVNVFAAAGVSLSKIGAGIPFYGYRWIGGLDVNGQGALYPGQILSTPASYDGWTYAALVANPTLFQPQYQRWDDNAKVPYLSIDNPGNANDMFITYENPTSITDKWSFVMQNQIGGIMVYPMGADWTPQGGTVPEQHPLSQALLLAVGGSPTAPTITSQSPLPPGSVGSPYTDTLMATGSTPIAWSVTSGSLPPGLSLSSTSGVVTGTPSSAGSWTFTVQASNTVGANSKSFSLTISATATKVTVQGRVTLLGAPLAGVKISASNGQVTSSSRTGHYTLHLPSGFTGSMTPSKTGYSFQPGVVNETDLITNITVNIAAR